MPYLAPKRELHQQIAIDLLRVFFGSALQLTLQVKINAKFSLFTILVFQAVIVLGFTPWRSVQASQVIVEKLN